MSLARTRSARTRVDLRRGLLAAAVLAIAALPVSAIAQTLDAVSVSPDITLDLGAAILTDEGAVLEYGSGTSQIDLGPLPSNAAVIAIDVVEGASTLFALDTTVELGGAIYRAGDVISWDGAAYALAWDANAAGLPSNARVDGVAFGPDASLYLSFDIDVDLGGTIVQDHDVLRVLSGGGIFLEFSDSFDDYGVRSLDVDAVTWLSPEQIGLSFDQPGIVGGVAFDDADVVRFDSNDETWALVFDASAVNAAYEGAVDIEAVTVPEPGIPVALGAGMIGAALLRRRRGAGADR